MKMNKLVKALAVAVTSFGIAANAVAEERSYILATASTGGTYYPVGVALATLSKVKLAPKHHFSLSAISSAGSGENVKLLNENEAQFAILQGLYGAWAWSGEGPYEKSGRQEQLRSVSMLWQNVEHFIVRSDLAKTGTVTDLNNLDGKKFSIGKKNSGTENSGRQIMKGLNVDPDKFNLAYMGYGGSASALQNGTIDGMNTPAGVPVGAVTQAFAALGKDISILSFTDEQIKEANGHYNLWTKYEIPANTYPGLDKPITTIAQPNFLAVREDISEEDVYQLTKAIYENLPFLQGIHKATKAMAMEKAIAGLPVPLHPGAARYYKEMGIEIPSDLMAK
ncbi:MULTISPECIES: TAXI family TRAP transporter solute-binding subunit [Vibrio]|jgi:TRAP transporter TAXI family solute receptor|uniref:TAXI family TRAP transporter solute-binding subunit n=2 Tax=Vibrio campbellii TaxID=680 RepID=A0A1P8MNA1_9VIBR|nr:MULTISPECIES: TAXI family TRAP transporter solute-binding subunit [Vibrio]EDL68022.1 immunogenic protein [Vibrio campbellii HY01]MED5503976.1 TAXI family TRAP transporter solute-binding subunit [Pseudomonadota bacterium]APX09453.1 C4-dicarboxylate ABC transporter substrate-binding protein [Vibrio campbellii]ARR08220.1 C4-dicarboxylate ABC transporter substrate-binding protein [Vibrio campbellii]ARR46881.1 C4-dicarboxylate ABC transporter substrate-binding protein [Vibrio campbellii]|tara:strand:- start:1199 stop:2209 length:1011 start_codon:yes stop_codon:yes gene_type:complete